MLFITVSRQTGSLGKEITELLAQKLDLPIINRDLVMSQWFPEIANKHELHMLSESPGFFLTSSQENISFAEYLENRLRDYIAAQPAIIFGLGAQIIFADHPAALHLKIIASQKVRTQRIMQTHCLEQKDAERFLALTDRKHKRYISTIYGKDWSDPTLYHLILNTDLIGLDEAAGLLYHVAQNKEIACNVEPQTAVAKDEIVVFKHPSEEEFAKILDMHSIEWEYEPRTFPTKWDTEGNVTQAFSPDFYLPRFDTYIELTTMNQKYVSEKKKKVALLRKLYPGININIVFKDDFNTLMKRFKLKDDVE
ncbi:MAG: cytidylate kinase-like family protein [Syntrophomonadaceae bacterium]|nr:cytidylate kinase-like family protein [Syntrophomonadaceae bacterium]